MPFTKTKCPTCGKDFVSVREFKFPTGSKHIGECGHLFSIDSIQSQLQPEQIVSMTGKKLFPYQCEGVRFGLDSGVRCLIGDEMGLGKTWQALGIIAMNQDLLPALFVVKSSLKVQWQHEIMNVLGEDFFASTLESAKDPIFPGFKAYIISYDLLTRIAKSGRIEELLNYGFKTVVLDEVQQIKNNDAKRTTWVKLVCQKIPHVIALSGMVIKNHAAEFFPILNILAPQIFSTFANFQRHWVDSYWDGYSYKCGGLRDPKRFIERTKNFIIRRTRDEVREELLKVGNFPAGEAIRRFSFHELSKEVEKAYRLAFLEFEEAYESTKEGGRFGDDSPIIAFLSRMRHLAGISLINPCIDHLMDFLGSSEDEKITVFFHHNDVGERIREVITSVLTELGLDPPLMFTSDLNSEQRNNVVQKFKEKRSRILLCSTIAGGEGLNLQFCSRFVMLERQWNPANEEQAESRFIRIGQLAAFVEGTYFIAVGTIVEYLSELVERKREIVKKSLSGEAVEWSQTEVISELCSILSEKGAQRWHW